MTWAEHVSRIGNVQGVAIKLGYPADYLLDLAERLRTSPEILGLGVGASEPDERGIYALAIPDYEARSVRVRGKNRSLLVPMPELMQLQKGIRELLRPAAEELLGSSCHGYRPNHSTLSNALPHCGAGWIQKFDVKDFFTSTTPAMVANVLKEIGFDAPAADLLTGLATVHNSLPMGSPSSPVISNLLLATFDIEVEHEATKAGVAYTRYADDMTFSANQDFDLREEVSSLLAQRGYVLASTKSVRARRGQNLTVTGLVTWDEELPRMPKVFRSRLETEMYFIERYGFAEHAFREYDWHWIDAEQQPEKHLSHSLLHLRGKLVYALGIQRTWAQALLARYPAAARAVLGDAADTATRHAERIELMRELANEVRSLTTPPAGRLSGR